jgi:Glycoside hydrolase family 44
VLRAIPTTNHMSVATVVPRAARVALGALATIVVACTSEPHTSRASAQIACDIDRATGTVHCETAGITAVPAPETDSSGTAIVLRAQHADVSVQTANAVWTADTVAFDATIRNLAGQPIGTVDGRSADPRGLRIRWVTPDVTDAPDDTVSRAVAELVAPQSSGAGSPAASAVDSPARFSTDAAAVVAMLDSGETSVPLRIRLRIPGNAAHARFAMVIHAPVQHPNGWLRVTPEAVDISPRETTKLRAARFDALGHRVPPASVKWITTTPALISLSDGGDITGRAIGVAQVIATCAVPCKARPDTAAVAVTDAAGVTLAIQPHSRFAISPFIYGINFITDDGPQTAGVPPWFGATVPPIATLNRIGGNRYSAYNWRTNFSNAGADYRFQNDRYVESTTTPGAAIQRRIAAARARGAASLITVPMLPFVAANDAAVPLDTLGATRAARLKANFAANRAERGAHDPADAVYQDEFVRWIDSTFPSTRGDSTRPIFFSLDNEPDIWHATHRAIMSDTNGGPRKQTYDGFSNTSIAFARAIKRARPQSLIFGPAVATYAGVMTLGQHPKSDPTYGRAPFFEIYLDRMQDAERQRGQRLLDVLDLHWYPAAYTSGGEITNDWAKQDSITIQARVQAPRSLWDSTYDEKSWVSQVTGGPIALIPRLRAMIDGHYRGTQLAISEYYFGRGGDISGGLAQADVLGIFGREGLFAATFWPQAAVGSYDNSGERAYAYVFGAFRLFRDYDGLGHTFGERGLGAHSSDPARASVYASWRVDGRKVLVVINKTHTALRATIPMTSGPQPTLAQQFTLQEGAAVPQRVADIRVAPGRALTLTLPPLSASTLVLDP